MNAVSTSHTELSVGDVVSNGMQLGLKNFIPLLLTGILYVLTVWIPYLNIGTTIGIADLMAKMSRGESISPTGIFDAKYRQNIGEFFLLFAFQGAAMAASLILYGAGLIIGIAWMLSTILFVDKNTDPLESLKLSTKLTHGNKLTIFLSMLVLYVIILIAYGLFMAVIGGAIGAFLAFLVTLAVLPVAFGIVAYVYGKLTSGLDDASFDQAVAEPAM